MYHGIGDTIAPLPHRTLNDNEQTDVYRESVIAHTKCACSIIENGLAPAARLADALDEVVEIDYDTGYAHTRQDKTLRSEDHPI